ncbi:uncharacterized protein [Asterias amurensis]|uniref:uncharacterized protein n=1 Tax=Asterias amurensis TaxID=7602 RepID=UPI003AB7CB9B
MATSPENSAAAEKAALQCQANEIPVTDTTEVMTCEECGSTFTNPSYFHDHNRWHNHVRKERAASIGKSTLGGDHHTASSVSDGIKMEKKDDAEYLAAHALLKPFACEYCGWRFVLRKDLVHHVRTHTGEKPYECSECGKRFARAHSLNQHKRTHEGPIYTVNYQTPPKQHDQTDKQNANDVIVPVEIPETKAFEVSPPIAESSPGNPPDDDTTLPWGYQQADTDGPSSASNTQAGLLTDSDTSLGEAPSGIHGGGKRGVRFTCQFCGWGFWDRKDKRQHEWTHTGYKPYKCSMCDKTFSRTYSRTLHMRTHSGERPYTCQHCDKTFPSPSSLRSHENVHTKIRRHKCTMCPESFKKMADFKEHQLEHLSTDPNLFATSYTGDSEEASATHEDTSSASQPFPVNITFSHLPGTSLNLLEQKSSDSYQQLNPTGVMEQSTEPDQFADPDQRIIENDVHVSETQQSANNEATMKQRQTDVVPSVNTYSSLLSGLLKKRRDVRFFCKHCEKGFHTKKECHQHETSHTAKTPLECSICGKNFSSQYLLKMHMIGHTRKTQKASRTNMKGYKCELCEETFTLEVDFTDHLQLHQNQDPARFIQYYPDGFNLGGQKVSYLKTLSPLSPSATNVPQTVVYSAAPISDSGSTQPQTTKRRKKPGRVPQAGNDPLRFGCSFCTRRFRCKKDWRQHENTHTGLKPYTCTVCGKKLSRHYTLKVHMLTHTGQKPISCAHCDKSFRVKSRLRTHERIHHAALCNPTLHNKCDLCQMAFKELSDLENHIRVGHDDVVRMMAKNFFNSTPVTSALFRPAAVSENQKLSVSSDEPYQEEITCTVRYISKRNRIIDPVAANAIDSWLEGNKVSGQARFMCHFCGKGFHNARDWQQHENTHTGYKPYACDICGKKLSRLHSLKAHKLRHLKGHPNVCQFYNCGKRFKEEAELDEHMKSHLSSFQCTNCQVCFETVFELEIHMAEHDKEGQVSAEHDKEGQDSVEYQEVPSGPFFFKRNGESSEKEQDSLATGPPKKKEAFKPMPGTIRYQCSYCGWRTEDFDIFKRHKIWHRRRKNKAGQLKKSCNKCGAAFVTNEKLEIHMRTCGFLCSLCRKPFKTKLLLEEHLKRHSEGLQESIHRSAGDESFEEASIVSLSETSGQDLLRGLSKVAVVSEETRSGPPEGGMSFNILESLLSRKNSVETTGVAPTARTIFPGDNKRKQPKKFVHATCRLCQKRFSHGYALKLHMVLHMSETPYKCKSCAKRFRSKDGLREHHNSNLSCSRGSIRPSTSSNVQAVPRVAETTPPLKKDSILYRQLKLVSQQDGRVKNKDSQPKPHQCSYCGWGFWLRKDCVVHERIHTGEKPYVCKTCGKSFARSYSLKLHNMTHSGVKPFHCRVCNKGFYCRGNVNAHERIHTSAKPNLNCKWCGVPFRSRSGLKKHEKLRHSGETLRDANSMNLGFTSKDREVELLVEPVKLVKSVGSDSLQKSKSGVCSFCGWNFHNVERMRRHLYWHRKRYFGSFKKRRQLHDLYLSNGQQERVGNKFKCTTCNASFHQPAVLKLHRKAHSSEQLYYCDCCPLKFEIYNEFSRHNALHHSRFACLYCDKFIDGSQELAGHTKACRARKLRLYSGSQAAKKVSLRCRRCKVTLRGPNAMRLHISHCHSTAHYASCLRCQKGFTSQEKFMRHLVRGCSSSDSGIYKPVARSEQMGYKQAYMSGETNPITPEVSQFGQISYSDTSFEMSNVSQTVPPSEAGGWVQDVVVTSEGPQNLVDQHLTDTGPDYLNQGASTSKAFQCPYCTSSFAQSFGLKQHVRIHTGEKPFICRECGRAFAQKINLNQHMATHSEEKPFKCQHCGKCFSRKVQIKRHLERMHSKELPYSCDQCPRSFKSSDELKRHGIIHFGKRRQHACKYCGWTFAEKRDMVNHERVHTGEKPFACKVCDMSFARTYSLTVHMRSHTGEKPHKCEVCSKGCSSAYNLKLHLKTHEKQQHLSESPMVKFWTENS